MPSSPSSSGSKKPERLQKLIAQAGLCSRREAEDAIRFGEVTLNGQVATLGMSAVWGVDAIKFRGKLISKKEPAVAIVLNKPRDTLCILGEDPEARPTIKPLLARVQERVFPIAPLGFTESGLVLLTNDGTWKQKFLKAQDIWHVYRVKVGLVPTAEQLERLQRGMRVDGVYVKPQAINLEQSLSRKAFLLVAYLGSLPEQFHEFCRRRGVIVDDVRRIGLGQIRLGDLEVGATRRLTSSQMEALFEQTELGERLFHHMDAKAPARKEKPRPLFETDRRETKTAPRGGPRSRLTPASKGSRSKPSAKILPRGGAAR